jgi:Cu(I)/Ag(I) efflux system membrane fusion protein
MITRRTRFATIGAVTAVAVLAIVGYGSYRLGVARGIQPATASAAARAPRAGAPLQAGDIDPTTGRRVLYWHDPMVPGRRFLAPGPSPFMDMPLVPVYDDTVGGGGGRVTVSPRLQQNLGIRTAEVVRGTLSARVHAVGNVAFDERDQVVVQARATAYIEQLQVRATLDRVAAGQPLAELYVPDWVAAQEEFLAVRRMRGPDVAALLDGARHRMQQVGMTEEQVRRIEQLGELVPRIALRAPIAGVVVELGAREGMTVLPGDTLFRINGLSTVWVNALVPESQAGLLKPGAAAEARSPAIPETVFAGSVGAILPQVDPTTRTITARVELANPDWQLAPGMFVDVALAGPSIDGLIVPTEAVIATGERTVVMVAGADGTFAPVDVELGIETNGQTMIRRGLAAGQRVVISGQFLLDSEANLRAAGTRMDAAPPPPGPTTEHFGEGTVELLDDDGVTISHGPIASLEWPSMTMEFALPEGGPLRGIESGQAVRFAFTIGADGHPSLTRIEPLAEDRP